MKMHVLSIPCPPLSVWDTGGPGCSGTALGVPREWGPAGLPCTVEEQEQHWSALLT